MVSEFLVFALTFAQATGPVIVIWFLTWLFNIKLIKNWWHWAAIYVLLGAFYWYLGFPDMNRKALNIWYPK